DRQIRPLHRLVFYVDGPAVHGERARCAAERERRWDRSRMREALHRDRQPPPQIALPVEPRVTSAAVVVPEVRDAESGQTLVKRNALFVHVLFDRIAVAVPGLVGTAVAARDVQGHAAEVLSEVVRIVVLPTD